MMLGSDYSGRSAEEREHRENLEEEEKEEQEAILREEEERPNEEASLDIAGEKNALREVGDNQEDFYNEFELGNMTMEEVIAINKMAPAGQKLEDTVAEDGQRHMEASVDTPLTTMRDNASSNYDRELAAFKLELDVFIGEHPFTILLNRNERFNTTQRRAFERELYDFVRGYGLSSSIANGILGEVKSQWQSVVDDSQTEWDGEELDEMNQSKKLMKNSNLTNVGPQNQALNGTTSSTSNGSESHQNSSLQSSLAALATNITNLEAALLRPIFLESLVQETQSHKNKHDMRHGESRKQRKLGKEKAKSEYSSKEWDENEEALKKANKKAKRGRRIARQKEENTAQKNADKLQSYHENDFVRGTPPLPPPKKEVQVQSPPVKAVGIDSNVIREDEVVKQPGQMSQEQVARIDAEIRGIRDFSNAKQVELFENGGMKGADKQMRNDLEEKKEERDYLRDAGHQTKLSRKRERTSNINEGNTSQLPHSKGTKKQKGVRDDQNRTLPNQSQSKKPKKDFRLPMKQRK